jgi:hypothetical protein
MHYEYTAYIAFVLMKITKTKHLAPTILCMALYDWMKEDIVLLAVALVLSKE